MSTAAVAQDINNRFRLGGEEGYFVTPKDADEAIAQGGANVWSLAPRLDLLRIYPRIDQETGVIAFFDAKTGLGTRIPLVLTFDEYFELRTRAQLRNLWPDLLRSRMQQILATRDPENLLSLELPVELPGILGGGTPNFNIIGRQR
ncbi:MAG: hypothetical protein HOH43_05255, partial [Candidatus Latescibacteria bacterium]|nr:hypothetical protein [Candidatus Latescibacterota bacterium]